MDIHHIVIIYRGGSHLVLAGTNTEELLDQLADALNEDLGETLDDIVDDDDYVDVFVPDSLVERDLDESVSQLYTQYIANLDGADDPIDVIAFTTVVDLVVKD